MLAEPLSPSQRSALDGLFTIQTGEASTAPWITAGCSTGTVGLVASMSRKSNCYDNAPIESFWGNLKNELVHHPQYATHTEADASIREYVEIFYNRQRRHSRLGNLAPAVFAQNHRQQQKAA